MEYLEKCTICDYKFKNGNDRHNHLVENHGINFEQYIINTVFDGIHPICKCGCGTKLTFNRTLEKGWYAEYAKNHFPRKKHTEETKQRIKENSLKAIQEKFGVDNVFQLENIKEKAKSTKLEKYGDGNYNNIEKNKATKKERYGNENYRNEEKIKETSRERYGKDYYMSTQKFRKDTEKTLKEKYDVDNIMQVDSVKEKLKQTNIEKYGVEVASKNKDVIEKGMKILQENNLKKYGVKYVLQVPSIRETIRKTNNEKYGVDYPSQTKEIQEKIKQTNLERYGVEYFLIDDETREKIKKTNLERYGVENYFLIPNFKKLHSVSYSKKELEVNDKINGEKSFIYKGKEYDIKKGNNLFEIDGDYYHSTKLTNLDLITLGSISNDFNKINDVKDSEYNLYKILISNLPEDITEESLIANSYVPDFTLRYNDIIVKKEYLQKLIDKNGKDYLLKYLNIFLKFIRTFQKEIPLPEKDIELSDLMSKIANYKNYDKIFNKETKVFNNNAYSLGNIYLKSIFKSYWNSAYKNNKTPAQIWQDDNLMKNVIKYRIGINNSGEIYDFSLRNLIKGISAVRGTISFFKPLVAASIYKEFIGEKMRPRVFDPCCGFGGRLLGFKSIYPNGIYIGCEPNIDTYNELLELSKDMNDVTIYNCKVEDLELDDYNFDLSFTSIPYFDLETYSNEMKYENIDEWKDTFIKSLYKFGNLLLNMPKDLEYLFSDVKDKYYLKNSVSKHLNKNDEEKVELILKFY